MKTTRLFSLTLLALLLGLPLPRALSVNDSEPPDFPNDAASAATYLVDLGSNVFSGTVPEFAGDADFFKITVPLGRRVRSISGAGFGLAFPPAPLPSGTHTISCAPGAIISDVNWSVTFTVDELVVTNANDSGSGSLRQAMANATANVGADTITFEPSLSGQTITLSSEISSTDLSGVTIDATGLATAPTISGNNATRLFRVASSAIVTLKGLKLIAGNGAGGGSPANYGGAIHSSGSLTLSDCTVAGSSTLVGGAIYNVIGAGTLTLDRCTFTGNVASFGGAIQNEAGLTATNCTFTGNAATQYGGAISTAFTTATVLRHCTVSGNAAFVGGGGLISSADLGNCIVANNATPGSNADIFKSVGTITSTGANLIGSNETVVTEFPAGALVGTPANLKDPQLAVLGNYGGRMQTMPPFPGSPAIDAAGGGTTTTDQRGASRTVGHGSARDLGAVELGQTLVNTTADENNGLGMGGKSLREALTDPAPFGSELIRFDPAVFTGATPATNTISLGSTITVTKSLAMVDAANLPAGLTIDDGAATTYRLLFVNPGSSLTLRGLTLANGGGAGFNGIGGAILNNLGTLTLTHCTLSGNRTAGFGGAIFSITASIAGPITSSTTLAHCTLTGNTAVRGGAMENNNGRTTLTHCTVTGNTATPGAGSGVASLGSTATETVVQNSIIAGNANSSVDFVGGGASNFTSQGHNLIGSGNATGDFNQPGDIINNASQLAPLGNYGGPTKTMLPLLDSPAIDAAPGSTAATDQRGASRTTGHGSAPDIGAVELGQTLVNTTADENNGLANGNKSLREALTDPAPFGSELIRFDTAVFNATNTISLASTIVVTRPIAMVDAANLPAGLTINDGAATDYGLLMVDESGGLTLRALTLANGGGVNFSGSGGAIRILSGTATLTQCTLSGNSTQQRGGAIDNFNGKLTLTQCTLSGNSAQEGGAIRSYTGSSTDPSNTTLSHCTLSGNTATTSGGAIHNNAGDTTLTHCTVSGNTAPPGAGSGVASYADTFTETVVENSIIAGNTNSSVDFVAGEDDYNSFTSQGHNLIGSGNATAAFDQNTDIINNIPLLAPLGSYGGRTQTMALRPGSPARNAAGALSPAITGDQRGFPIVGTPDIGAYEAGTTNTFALWAIENAGGAVSFTADQENDGNKNGLEYATRTDPLAANPSPFGQPTSVVLLPFNIPGYQFTFAYRPGATDLRYIVYRSPDLVDWTEIFRYDLSTGGLSTLVFYDTNAAAQTITLGDPYFTLPACFWKLIVEKP